MKSIFVLMILTMTTFSAVASSTDNGWTLHPAPVAVPGTGYNMYAVDTQILLATELTIFREKDCNDVQFRAVYDEVEGAYYISADSTLKQCEVKRFARRIKQRVVFYLKPKGSHAEMKIYVPQGFISQIESYVRPPNF